MIHTYSKKLAEHLINELNLDNQRIPVISYGLEVIIGGFLKLTTFIFVPWLFGVLNQFTTAYITSAFLRLPSGGAHCTAYYKCLINTLVVFLIIALIAKHTLNPLPIKQILWISLFLALLVFVKIAPVVSKEKPIVSLKRRRNLKIASSLILVIYFIVSLYWNPKQDILIASSLAILFHIFTLTKLGHKLLSYVDKLI